MRYLQACVGNTQDFHYKQIGHAVLHTGLHDTTTAASAFVDDHETTPECAILSRKLTCGFGGVGENSHKPSLALYCVGQLVLPQQIWKTPLTSSNLVCVFYVAVMDKPVASDHSSSSLSNQLSKVLLQGHCGQVNHHLMAVSLGGVGLNWPQGLLIACLPILCE